MEQPLPPVRDGYDVAIKVLTIVKLLIQVALWGLMLGGTLYLIRNNPLPKILSEIQTQAMSQFLSK